MNNENKPLMSPDRVLSMVVFVLSLLMIMGTAFLYYTNTEMSNASAMIGSMADRNIQQLHADRQQALQAETPEEDLETQ